MADGLFRPRIQPRAPGAPWAQAQGMRGPGRRVALRRSWQIRRRHARCRAQHQIRL